MAANSPLHLSNVKPRVSSSKKEAYDFFRQKELGALYMSSGHGIGFDDKRLKKFAINYDLLNGRANTKTYGNEKLHSYFGETFKLEESEQLVHYPLISQVCQTMIGEHLRRNFSLVVKDLSPFKESFEAKEYNSLLKQDLQVNFLGPIRQMVEQRMVEQIGAENLGNIAPEQQEQLKKQLDAQVNALTPEEIIEYMNTDYRTPIAKQGQEVIDFLSYKLKLREQNHEGFIHMLPTGEEYYYVDVHRDQLVFEMVPPDELRYGGDRNKTNVEDMDWVVRTKYMTIPSVTEEYAEYLTISMIEDIEDNLVYMPGETNFKFDRSKWQDMPLVKLYVEETSKNAEYYENKYENLDSNTKKGHSNMIDIMHNLMNSRLGEKNLSDWGVKVEHCVFKDNRKFYKVFKYNPEEDKIEKHYFADFYEPVEEDILVESFWGKEVWEVTRIGGQYWVKAQPVKYQKATADSPYGLKLPYVGQKYNTFKNRSDNMAVVDKGKTFNRDFDIQMSRIKKKLDTDLGNLLLYVTDSKPENMTTKEWFKLIKDWGIVGVQGSKHGMPQTDQQVFKGVSANKLADIGQNIELLEFFRSNTFSMMYFNQARMGALGQYANTANIQSQQSSSFNQTEDVFNTHRLIFQRAAARLLNIARLHYKDHPEQIEHILSPTSLQELKAGRKFFYFEMGIELENSGFALQQIEFLKNNFVQFMSGAGGQGMEEVLELMLAKSESDVVNVVKKFSKKMKEQQAEARQFELEQSKIQGERLEKVEQARLQANMQLEQMKMESLERRAQLQSMTIANANDIDRDGKHDLNEIKDKEIAFKRDQLQINKELKEKELALKY